MGTNKKQRMIDAVCTAAIMCVGIPYRYGAYAAPKEKGMPEGVDCSSFIQYAFAAAGIDLPRSSILQATKGKTIQNRRMIIPGDLLFFEGDRGHYYYPLFGGKKVYIGHVALYLGDGRIIHAREVKKGVVIENLDSFTKNKYCNLVRIQRVV